MGGIFYKLLKNVKLAWLIPLAALCYWLPVLIHWQRMSVGQRIHRWHPLPFAVVVDWCCWQNSLAGHDGEWTGKGKGSDTYRIPFLSLTWWGGSVMAWERSDSEEWGWLPDFTIGIELVRLNWPIWRWIQMILWSESSQNLCLLLLPNAAHCLFLPSPQFLRVNFVNGGFGTAERLWWLLSSNLLYNQTPLLKSLLVAN